MKLTWIQTSGSGGDVFQRNFFLELCRLFFQQSETIRAILVKGIMKNNSVNLFRIWAIV